MEVFGRFLAGFRQRDKITGNLALFLLYRVKPTRGLELQVILSIYRKPSGGFLDNPSFADHTVDYLNVNLTSCIIRAI